MNQRHRISNAPIDEAASDARTQLQATAEVALLAARAARAAGFGSEQSGLYGRAAVRHIDAGLPAEALLDGLRFTHDSPLVRLPLLLDDIRRAMSLLGSQIALTINGDDADLLPAYLDLLSQRIIDRRIDDRNDAPPQLHLTLAQCGPPPAAPRETLEVPGRLLDGWRSMIDKRSSNR